jgi:hypothetical protein
MKFLGLRILLLALWLTVVGQDSTPTTGVAELVKAYRANCARTRRSGLKSDYYYNTGIAAMARNRSDAAARQRRDELDRIKRGMLLLTNGEWLIAALEAEHDARTALRKDRAYGGPGGMTRVRLQTAVRDRVRAVNALVDSIVKEQQ